MHLKRKYDPDSNAECDVEYSVDDVRFLVDEITRIREENNKLKMEKKKNDEEKIKCDEEKEEIIMELRKKDEKLENVEYELMVTTRLLDRLAQRQGVFYRFPLFPPEIRHMIYSNLPLFDRYAAAKANPEMEAYFVKYPVKGVFVKFSLEERRDGVYVRIEYRGQLYVEMFRIPNELIYETTRDWQSSHGCTCGFCNQEYCIDDGHRDFVLPVRVRYLDYDPRNVGTVFHTFRLVDITLFHLKSSPTGGLVDFFLPVGQLRGPCTLHVYYHLQEGAPVPRDDPRLNIARWAAWFDFLRPKKVEFSKNFGKPLFRPGSYWDDGPPVHIPKVFLDTRAVRSASSVSFSNCLVDINCQQLVLLKANEIHLHKQSSMLTSMDVLKFYKLKIKEWMREPTTRMRFFLLTGRTNGYVPYLDWERLLEDVREELSTTDFRVYPNYDFHSSNIKYYKDHISIRCMKTDECLLVERDWLRTGRKYGYKEEYVWPKKHGL